MIEKIFRKFYINNIENQKNLVYLRNNCFIILIFNFFMYVNQQSNFSRKCG